MEKCPDCGVRFSEWFVWDGWCYCWPCYQKDGIVRTDNGKRFDPEAMGKRCMSKDGRDR